MSSPTWLLTIQSNRLPDRARPRRLGRVLAQIFMIVATALWLVPILFALYVSLRPYSETSKYGYVSLPHHLSLSNFAMAWSQSGMWRFFLNWPTCRASSSPTRT